MAQVPIRIPSRYNRFRFYSTPEGLLELRAYEMYTGIRGQLRLGFVDRVGRVHHFNVSELRP